MSMAPTTSAPLRLTREHYQIVDALIRVWQQDLATDEEIQIELGDLLRTVPRRTLRCAQLACTAWDRILAIARESCSPEVMRRLVPKAIAKSSICPSVSFLIAARDRDLARAPGEHPTLKSRDWAALMVAFGHLGEYSRLRQIWAIWSEGKNVDDKRRMLLHICKTFRYVSETPQSHQSCQPVEMICAIINTGMVAWGTDYALHRAVRARLAIPIRTAAYAIEPDRAAARMALGLCPIQNDQASWQLLESVVVPGPQHQPLVSLTVRSPIRLFTTVSSGTPPCQAATVRSGRTMPVSYALIAAPAAERANRPFGIQIGDSAFWLIGQTVRPGRHQGSMWFWTGPRFAYRLPTSRPEQVTALYSIAGVSFQIALPDLFYVAMENIARHPWDSSV